MAGIKKSLTLLMGVIVGMLVVLILGSFIVNHVLVSAHRENNNTQDSAAMTVKKQEAVNKVAVGVNTLQQKVEEQVQKEQAIPPVQGQIDSQVDSGKELPAENSESGKELENGFNTASAAAGEQVEAIPEPVKKFFFWGPFDFAYKAKSFAAQVKDKSGVDCLIEKENGEYSVYFLYDDENDRLEKISLIEEATKLKINDHDHVY